jgi:phosphate transport system substrate-binding protein
MPKKNGLAVRFRNTGLTLLLITVQALVLPRGAMAQQITVRGSDTLIYLGQRFAAVYSRNFPGLHIGVLGGGWTPGVNAIASGRADVAQTENDPSPLPGDLVSFPVGVQAIVVYVNESNPVRELTIGQVRSIFMGQTTNWKTFGGPDSTILLYAGESTTGTLA